MEPQLAARLARHCTVPGNAHVRPRCSRAPRSATHFPWPSPRSQRRAAPACRLVIVGFRLHSSAEAQRNSHEVLHVKQLACPLPPPSPSRRPGRLADPGPMGHPVRPGALLHLVAAPALRPGDGRHRPAVPVGPRTPPLLRADLDAAFLHVYGLTRPEAEHVLDSFAVVRKYEERDHGEYRTRRLVLESYDRIATAAGRGGAGWSPLADLPAGRALRHPASSRAMT